MVIVKGRKTNMGIVTMFRVKISRFWIGNVSYHAWLNAFSFLFGLGNTTERLEADSHCSAR